MRKIIILISAALLLSSCDDKFKFHEKEHGSVVSPSIIVVSVEYLNSSPEVAKYGIMSTSKLDYNFTKNSMTIYYYDTAGKFNVGDKVIFEKLEKEYEDKEVEY